MPRKIITIAAAIFILTVSAIIIFAKDLTYSYSYYINLTPKPATLTPSPTPINQAAQENSEAKAASVSESKDPGFVLLWLSDFEGNKILGLDTGGKIKWEQRMDSPPIPPASYNIRSNYVTVAPNGNLIITDKDGMMVQEIDRKTHKLLWQYGEKSRQGYTSGLLDQPDKSFKINDHEVVINDGNNRRVIIVDQKTNSIVWQYGESGVIGSSPGLLRGNTSVRPLKGGEQFIITDTLDKKILIVDRISKNIIWEWQKPDSNWLEHVFPTERGTFILEDRRKNEIFEVNRDGKILWSLKKLSDDSNLSYPTDAIELKNGNLLVAEAGRGRVIEVNPSTGEVMKQFKNIGFVSAIAIDPPNFRFSERNGI